MEYINAKEPPVRENRLGSCNSYGGNARHLLGCAKRGCMNLICRKFHQTQLCQSSLCLSWADSVPDPVVIMHSPVGCGAMNMFKREIFFGQPDRLRYVRTINTNLGESDIITGGEQSLREAILYAENEFHPKNIFILMTCVPTLTGDDVEAVIESVTDRIKADIMPVYCAGFKSKIPASAYDALYHGMIKVHLEGKKEKAIQNLRRKKENKVNLFIMSSASDADINELRRLLEAIELEVRVLPYNFSVERLAELTDASLNISACATHDGYMFQYLEETYGMPYVIKNIPIGIKNTSSWLLEAAKFFGKEKQAKDLIARETEKLKKSLGKYKNTLQGKTAFIHGGEPRSLATAEILEMLGMEVLGIEARHHDKFSDEMLEGRKDNTKMTYSVAIGQPFEKANLLEKMRPDIYIGHNGQCVQPAKQGIPVAPLFYKPDNYFGFTGLFERARGLSRMMKNVQFYKNLRENLSLPYKKSWYGKEPFSYIKTSEFIQKEDVI